MTQPTTNLLVSQSGGPTPVLNATLAGVIEAAQQLGFPGIYGLVHGVQGALEDRAVDLSRLSPSDLQRLQAIPGAALGSSRYQLQEGELEQILEFMRRRQIGYFVAIGGNGSMAACQRLAEFARQAGDELCILGAPKTIDNDLPETDHSPGYGSAARFCALATRDVGLDLEAMRRFDDVHILECLGRDAGWITAASILGKYDEDEAPHLVYLPELPFDEKKFLDDVSQVHSRLGRVVVTIGEGLRDASGHYLGQPLDRPWGLDRNGNSQVTLTGGAAAYLAELVRRELKLQSRSPRPLFTGRTSTACTSPADRQEAYEVGRFAVERLAQNASGQMVSIRRISDQPYQVDYELVPLEKVVAGVHPFPREYIHPHGNQILPAFKTYLEPLIGGPLPELLRFPI
jgi:6-phosphofructokinase 1